MQGLLRLALVTSHAFWTSGKYQAWKQTWNDDQFTELFWQKYLCESAGNDVSGPPGRKNFGGPSSILGLRPRLTAMRSKIPTWYCPKVGQVVIVCTWHKYRLVLETEVTKGAVTRGNFFLQLATYIWVKKIFQAPVECRHMQVVVWPAVGLFCKLKVLQEAISLVKGSLKRRCVASCKKKLPRVTWP